MHASYQSKPATLTHLSNPVFAPPTIESFFQSMKPQVIKVDHLSTGGADSNEMDSNFEQALDMNQAGDDDMLGDDLDVDGKINKGKKQTQKVLEIKNEEFQRIGKAEVAGLASRFADL